MCPALIWIILATAAAYAFINDFTTSAVILSGFAALMTLILWLQAPIWMTSHFDLPNAKDRAEIQDSFRKSIAQALGGLALIATFAWTLTKDRETLNQARIQQANQQYVEAAKLLKETAPQGRMAGVYALEQAARLQPEFRTTVIAILAGFLRAKGHSDPPASIPHRERIDPDAQAAISVLADLNAGERPIPIDFRNAYLVGGKFADNRNGKLNAFSKANFQAAILYGAQFNKLDLTDTRFDGSSMADWEAHRSDEYGSPWNDETPRSDFYKFFRHLFTVNFSEAILVNTGFDNVKMGGVNFVEAQLAGSTFARADLSRARFARSKLHPWVHSSNALDKSDPRQFAEFRQAVLICADFDGVDLERIAFVEANLTATDFSKAANADKAIVTKACSNDASLLPFKNLPPCSTQPAPACPSK
jgi:uncharacterized protein YjbI with pentapeptide repeats